MTTRIRFDDAVPRWLRAHCRRWFRLLFPDDWRLRISMQDADEMAEEHGEGTAAVTVSLPTYLDAAVRFAAAASILNMKGRLRGPMVPNHQLQFCWIAGLISHLLYPCQVPSRKLPPVPKAAPFAAVNLELCGD